MVLLLINRDIPFARFNLVDDPKYTKGSTRTFCFADDLQCEK
jgi:hypothetical protein